MNWKQEVRRRLENLTLEPTREAEIIEELAQHLEDRYAELLASGATATEARASVLVELSEINITGSRVIERSTRCNPRESISTVVHHLAARALRGHSVVVDDRWSLWCRCIRSESADSRDRHQNGVGRPALKCFANGHTRRNAAGDYRSGHRIGMCLRTHETAFKPTL